jgi:hypothetical protein
MMNGGRVSNYQQQITNNKPQMSLSRSALQTRSLTLSVVASPVLGAYFFGHTDYESPWRCPLLTLTGIPCPGCGLTRSFVAIARGEWGEAVSYHLLGPIFFAGCIVLSAYLILEIVTQRRFKIPGWRRLYRRRGFQLSLVLIPVVYHGMRLYSLAISGELAISFARSPLAQWLSS